MKKEIKHPKDMTADEVIAHLFHPKALEHLKEHIKKLAEGKKKPSSKRDK
jgi:uncharacterized ferredoxin-like protein